MAAFITSIPTSLSTTRGLRNRIRSAPQLHPRRTISQRRPSLLMISWGDPSPLTLQIPDTNAFLLAQHTLQSLLALSFTMFLLTTIYSTLKDVFDTSSIMHAIPCSRCLYYHGQETQMRVKCSVWNDKACTRNAIGCVDFVDRVSGIPADPEAEKTLHVRILQSSLEDQVY